MNTEEKGDVELKKKDEGGDIKLKIIDEDETIKKGKHRSMKRPEKDKKLEIEKDKRLEIEKNEKTVSESDMEDKRDEDEYKKSEKVLSNMIIISPNQDASTFLRNHAKKIGRQIPILVQEIVEEWVVKQKKGKSRGMSDIQRLDDIDEKLNSMEIAVRGNISQMRRRVRELKERNREKNM